MKSLKEWRKLHEEVAGAVQAPEQDVGEPNQDDVDFFKQRVYGQLGRYLEYFKNAAEKTQSRLSRWKKGFIVQEVMKAIGMDESTFRALLPKIRRVVQDHERPPGQMAPQTTTPVPGGSVAPQATMPIPGTLHTGVASASGSTHQVSPW